MDDIYTLKTWQWLPLPRDIVFHFFADAFNLERITPDWLRFKVLTSAPISMERGALIDYRLRLHRVPIGWRTEIAEWEPPRRFIDRQVRGPYLEWHHTHDFDEQDGGTQVTDVVRYRLRGPALAARLINRWLVEPDTTSIFTYRQSALERALDVEGRTRRGPVTITPQLGASFSLPGAPRER